MVRPSSSLVKVSAVRVMRPARARASRRTSNCFAIDAEGEVGVELAGGARRCVGEGGEDGAEVAGLRGGGRGEGLGGGGGGRAEVALAAGAVGVGGVAEVADDGGHAALLGFGEGDHAVDLGAAEGDLGFVAGAPGFFAGDGRRCGGRCRRGRWWLRPGR